MSKQISLVDLTVLGCPTNFIGDTTPNLRVNRHLEGSFRDLLSSNSMDKRGNISGVKP